LVNPMTVRQIKRVMIAAVVLLCLGTVAIIAGGLLSPVSVEAATAPVADGSTSGDATSDSNAATSTPAVPLNQLRQVALLPLRRALFDPPPPPKPPQHHSNQAQRPRSQLAVRLIGTIVEPGRSAAMFQMPDNQIMVCMQGPGKVFLSIKIIWLA